MSDPIATIKEWVIKGKKNEAVAATREALAAGVDPGAIMKDGLIAAMSIVGQKYSSGEFFLPQMMIAARAMTEVIPVLKPLLVGAAAEAKGKAVIGTVQGDFHDIGKNIVKMMLEGAGYVVVDLGVDVPADRFVDAVKRESPQFVLMSALITLTMESMRRTIQALDAAGLRTAVKVGVGGAPLTHKYAAEIGADFYSEDAYGCVQVCNQYIAA
ncbi:MAG: corrinoid protein [Burkholderiales bacterium]|nr:corrinoid protein [Burkholderiales bacterium]MCC7114860.1 corrinoid protein [Burkholderiales bacterium]